MIMMRYIDDPHEIPLSNMSPLRLKAIRELLECYFPHMDCRYDIRSEGRIRVKILHVHSICKSLMETSPELNNYYVVIHYDISKGRLVFRIACEDNYLRDHPQGFSKVLLKVRQRNECPAPPRARFGKNQAASGSRRSPLWSIPEILPKARWRAFYAVLRKPL